MGYYSGICLARLRKTMEDLSGFNATGVLESKNEINDMAGNKGHGVNRYEFNRLSLNIRYTNMRQNTKSKPTIYLCPIIDCLSFDAGKFEVTISGSSLLTYENIR
jgi:hypothetical protein